ncbi:metallophosphoesterase [Caldimonas brevitalea]|uniref:metallophosphoesterase n=1 Tax=Caldimonas brevitalea TaxID=413882 RepID=UPI000ADB5746|nr:metallophosphoesterase [Caldimonas brevitalea]
MTRILIYSDLHLEFGAFTPPSELDYDVVVLAGDIHTPGLSGVLWAGRDSVFGGRPVVYVPGNHEFYGRERRRQLEHMRAVAHGTNVHVMDRDDLVIAGVRFLGVTLWTDFRLYEHLGVSGSQAAEVARTGMNDFRLIREREDGDVEREGRCFQPEVALREHRIGRAWLQARLHDSDRRFAALPTVVVTHHAPSPRSVPQAYRDQPLTAAFASDLPQEFFERARLWVHGHLHHCSDYRIGTTRVICNPRGYYDPTRKTTDNPGFDPRLVVSVTA